MDSSYGLELGPDENAALLLRFQLGCVDFASIGTAAERAAIGKSITIALRPIHTLFVLAKKSHRPSLPPNVYHKTKMLASARALVAQKTRPGAETAQSRECVWELQTTACRRFANDKNFHALLERCNIADQISDFTAKSSDEVKKKAYIDGGDLSAIDEVLRLRVRVTNSLLKCARFATGAEFKEDRDTLIELGVSTFKRTEEEDRFSSTLYAVLSARLLLSCTSIAPALRANFKTADNAIAEASQPYRIKLESLGIRDKNRATDLISSLEGEVERKWLDAVRDSVAALWAAEQLAINKIFDKIDEVRQGDAKIWGQVLSSQETLVWRWRELHKSVANRAPTAGELRVLINLRAAFILTFLQLAGSAIRLLGDVLTPALKLYQKSYREATAFARWQLDSLGADHVLNFGSHAISQRTAKRYNII